MTTARVIAVAREIQKDLEVTSSDLSQCARDVPDDAPDRDAAWREDFLNLSGFRQLFQQLEVLMHIPQQLLVSHLVWCRTKRFELTNESWGYLKKALMTRRPTNHKGTGMEPVAHADFEALCVESGIISQDEKSGISKAATHALFQKVQKDITSHIEKRAHSHPGLNAHAHFNPYVGKSRGKGGVIGRTEMSILMEEFHKDPAICKQFRSPLAVVGQLGSIPADACKDDAKQKTKSLSQDLITDAGPRYMEWEK